MSSSVYTGTLSPILVNGLMCVGEEDSVSKCNQTGAVCLQGRAGLICQGVLIWSNNVMGVFDTILTQLHVSFFEM